MKTRVRRTGVTPHAAFTILELLVAISILGLLTGLLLAAVQKVRASAARSQCQNQLRQIGLGLHHYNESLGHLPPGVSGDAANEPFPYMSWCSRILPYLGEQVLWDLAVAAFRQDRDFLNVPPHTCLGTPVRLFACSSDERVRRAHPITKQNLLRAFTSYVGVNGYNATRSDGVLFLNSRVSLTDISDGTSNTLAVGERPPSPDFVFGWWYAGWGQDKDGEADMVLGVRTVYNTTFGRKCNETGPFDFKQGSFVNQCDAFHFWSPHPGGANFLLCDGSVRFLSYSANPIMPALASRAGGEAQSVP